MAKKRIRLSEKELRHIIGEVLNEAVGDYGHGLYWADNMYGGDLDAENDACHCGVGACRDDYPEGKEGDEEYSWALRDQDLDISNGYEQDSINAYPEYGRTMWNNNERLHTLDRQRDGMDWQEGDHAYCDDGVPYPSRDWAEGSENRRRKWDDWVEDGERYLDMQGRSIRDDFNGRRREMRDLEKADRRPLHRKGSLNRELMRGENVMRKFNKVIRESVRHSLNKLK